MTRVSILWGGLFATTAHAADVYILDVDSTDEPGVHEIAVKYNEQKVGEQVYLLTCTEHDQNGEPRMRCERTFLIDADTLATLEPGKMDVIDFSAGAVRPAPRAAPRRRIAMPKQLPDSCGTEKKYGSGFEDHNGSLADAFPDGLYATNLNISVETSPAPYVQYVTLAATPIGAELWVHVYPKPKAEGPAAISISLADGHTSHLDPSHARILPGDVVFPIDEDTLRRAASLGRSSGLFVQFGETKRFVAWKSKNDELQAAARCALDLMGG